MIGPGLALRDAIRQIGAHVMHRKIRERMKGSVAQTFHVGWLGGEALGVASVAAQFLEHLESILSGRAQRIAECISAGIYAT